MPDYTRLVLEHARISSRIAFHPATFVNAASAMGLRQAYRTAFKLVSEACETEPPSFQVWKDKLELMRAIGAVEPADSPLMQPGGSVYNAVDAYYQNCFVGQAFHGWTLRICKDVFPHRLNSSRVLSGRSAFSAGHPGYHFTRFDNHEAPLNRIELVHPAQGTVVLWET